MPCNCPKVEIVTTFGFVANDTSQQLVPENQYRRELVIQNQSPTEAIRYNVGKPATFGLGSGVIGPGENYLVDFAIFHNSVEVIADAGKTVELFVMELETPAIL
jgi:hypothetical protein